MNQHEVLKDQLLEYNFLSDSEIESICSSFEEEKISRNHFFIKAGKRCSKVGFLCSGILCSFIINSEGHEVVKHFLEPVQLFTDLDSYNRSLPARLNITAITDSIVLSIDKHDNDELQARIPQWEYVQGILAARALNGMVQMQNFLHFGSAGDQYDYFLTNYPNLVKHVPLKYIASYLGITQSSLSRLRRQNLQ